MHSILPDLDWQSRNWLEVRKVAGDEGGIVCFGSHGYLISVAAWPAVIDVGNSDSVFLTGLDDGSVTSSAVLEPS